VPLSVDGSNRIMEREFRFQRALEGTLVPHARPLVLCTDPSVTGAMFYVMERIDGVLPLDPLPEEIGGPSAARRVAEELLDALAALSSVDYTAAGLSDLGKPDGFLERQVGRWRGQLESYQQRDLPGIDEVADWLDTNRPTTTVPGIMHGDYNRHNALFSREQPTRLLAVLDWENATIGDPLMDLGASLAYWIQPDDDAAFQAMRRQPTHAPGMLSQREVIWLEGRTLWGAVVEVAGALRRGLRHGLRGLIQRTPEVVLPTNVLDLEEAQVLGIR